jgi:hypothetical protein
MTHAACSAGVRRDPARFRKATKKTASWAVIFYWRKRWDSNFPMNILEILVLPTFLPTFSGCNVIATLHGKFCKQASIKTHRATPLVRFGKGMVSLLHGRQRFFKPCPSDCPHALQSRFMRHRNDGALPRLSPQRQPLPQ